MPLPGVRRRSTCGCAILAAAIVVSQLLVPAPADAQGQGKRVLVLYSTRWDAQLSIIGEAELPRLLLGAGSAPEIDYYAEYLDLSMFSGPVTNAFHDFLRVKYENVRFDLVIALQNAANAFINEHRNDLFADSPVVFLTNDPAMPRPPNATGVIHEQNFADTVRFIRELQPDVRQIFVVTGAGNEQRYEHALREQLPQFSDGPAVTYLAGLPTNELEDRLSSLPARSAVYYLSVSTDGAGEGFHPLEYLDRVALAANAPTYSWVDSALGRGIVGGSVYSQRAAIRAVGRVAQRVLRGELPANIAVESVNLNANAVDWRQLQRWRIDEARLPAGTVIRFREPTIWDQYGVYVLAALTLVAVQAILITGLLIQRVRRRRAESELRARETELRKSYERNRDLGGRLLGAQDTERARIARELHDDICQRMLLLTIELQSMASTAGTAPGPAGDALRTAKEISTSLHELSHRLHPTKLRLIGLVPALERLCLELSRAGVHVACTHANVPPDLPPDVMLCLFRVVQEALQNAIKYSGAREITVHLGGGIDGLTLTVADDGAGFDVDAAWGKGVGLMSMVERLEAIGGALDIRSSPGGGTSLAVSVPLPGTQRALA